MHGGNATESSFHLSVKISAGGRRIVKTHFLQQNREMYEDQWHIDDHEDEMYRSNRYYQKARNHKANIWFKIRIPHGRQYNKAWLLNSIQQECGFHFQAFQFHYMYDAAIFFVDNFNVAKSLERASKKIQGENYYRIVVNAVPSKLPYSHMRTMHSVSVRSVTVSNMEGYLEEPRTSHIQRCLQKRYNGVRQSLDLSNFCNDPGLRSARIFLPLNKTSSIDLILQMLSEFCPQLLSLNLSCNNLIRLTGFAALYYTTPRLRSLNLSQNKLFLEQDLELIQNLDLRELWLEGNPIYASMMNSSAYYRSVLYHFPGVQKLDGKFFKPSFSFEIKATGALPPVKGSFCVSEEVKSFLTTFIHKFFTLYDSGRRQALLPLYHENAVCSFSLPNVRFPKICFDLLKDFQKENRNLMKVRKPDFRMQLLKYNKLQVVGFLCNLPKTKHDLQSLTLDVSLQTMTLLCFSLEGKFKEDVDSRDLIRAFRRTFIIVPAAESRAEILNDQMVVVNSYMRLKDPAPNALYGSSEGKPLTPERLDVVTAFSQQTGMKMEWALKCLSDNQWDLAQAGNMFTLLQNNGVIPQEAFTDAAPRNAAPRNAVL